MHRVKYGWVQLPGLFVQRARFRLVLERKRPPPAHHVAMQQQQQRSVSFKDLSPAERERVRLRSKAIPLVADNDPIDIVFEDDDFLVVNKPDFVKMHPSHR